jgi:hypothetical protein
MVSMRLSSQQTRPVFLTLTVFAMLAVSGCTRALPPRVTCSGVRALKPRMSAQEVVGLIGDPARRGPSVILQDGSHQGPEVWVYNSEGFLGGIRFTLEFEGSALQKASAYYRYMLDNRSTTLYFLDEVMGAREGAQFSEYFSCELKKVAVR